MAASSLDAFFAAAARFSRHRAPSVPRSLMGGQLAELWQQAPGLVAAHPDRAAEIAISLTRLPAAPHLVKEDLKADFAKAYSQTTQERLLASGTGSFPQEQARQALLCYITLCDLLPQDIEVRKGLVQHVVTGASLLDGPALAAALPKVRAGEAAVSCALQAALSSREDLLGSMSAPDLAMAIQGLAGAQVIDGRLADLLVKHVGARLPELPPLWICRVSRAAVEIYQWQEQHEPDSAVQKLRRAGVPQPLQVWWPTLANAVAACLDAATSEPSSAIGCAAELSRAFQALPRSLQGGFHHAVLIPNTDALVKFASSIPDGAMLRILWPMLRAIDETAWQTVLQQIALESLGALTDDSTGDEMLVELFQAVAATVEQDGQQVQRPPPAFPAFFDFVLEDLMRRIHRLSSQQLRRILPLLASQHFERQDLLADAASHVVSALLPEGGEPAARASLLTPADVAPESQLSRLALSLSTLAALSSRLLDIEKAAGDGGEVRAAATRGLARSLLEVDAASCEHLLVSSDGNCSLDTPAAADAAFLALSASMQVLRAIQDEAKAAGAPQSLEDRGRGLLVAISQQLVLQQQSRPLTDPQLHILATALKVLYAAPGTPPIASALRTLIEKAVKEALVSAGGNRDARLFLAMMAEMAMDKRCSPALREAIAPLLPTELLNLAGSSRPPVPEHAARLRQHVQDFAGAPPSAGQAARKKEGGDESSSRGGWFGRLLGGLRQ